MVLQAVVYTKNDRGIFVNEINNENNMRENFKPCQLSDLCTPGKSMCKVGVTSVLQKVQ